MATPICFTSSLRRLRSWILPWFEEGALPEIAVAALASSTLYDVYTADNAFGGNLTTFWSTAPTVTAQPAFLTADLGSEQTMSKVRLLPRAGFDVLFPSTFTIDVSTDGVNWTQAASQSSYSAGTGTWYEKTFPNATARYVRLAVAATRLYSNGYYYAQVAEFQVHNPYLVGLSWTAPGDNALAGTAASYDIRWSTTPITDEATWATATELDGAPTPSAAGTTETFIVDAANLPSGNVYFAVRARDEGEVGEGCGYETLKSVTTNVEPECRSKVAPSRPSSNMPLLNLRLFPAEKYCVVVLALPIQHLLHSISICITLRTLIKCHLDLTISAVAVEAIGTFVHLSSRVIRVLPAHERLLRGSWSTRRLLRVSNHAVSP